MFSFTARKKRVDFQGYIRRLIDLTSPNRANSEELQRCENRYNRVIPALLCPWEQGAPVVSKAVVAITRDIADQGVGLILNDAFVGQEVVVGFCDWEATSGSPWFFLGTKRTSLPIGGGYWLLGIEFSELINEIWPRQLEPLVGLAEKLRPPCAVSEHANALLDHADDLLDLAKRLA
jgi:hypothetical protein